MGLPVTTVKRKRGGLFVADFRTQKGQDWDGHIRPQDHVPDAVQLTDALRRALPSVQIIKTHEAVTDWRDDPAEHIRYETTLLFRINAANTVE